MTVHELNSDAWTPEYVVGQLAQCRKELDHIAVAVRFKDGTLGTMTSKMPVEVLALLAARLDCRVHATILGGQE